MRGGSNLLTAVLLGVQLAAFERPPALTIPRGAAWPGGSWITEASGSSLTRHWYSLCANRSGWSK
jgi:hypothetical protein